MGTKKTYWSEVVCYPSSPNMPLVDRAFVHPPAPGNHPIIKHSPSCNCPFVSNDSTIATMQFRLFFHPLCRYKCCQENKEEEREKRVIESLSFHSACSLSEALSGGEVLSGRKVVAGSGRKWQGVAGSSRE